MTDAVEAIAREIYDSFGYAYSGRTITAKGEPYGMWGKCIAAARRVAALPLIDKARAKAGTAQDTVEAVKIAHVRQEDRYGCVLASIAMVLGRSYADVRAELGDPDRGHTKDFWREYLARKGYAIQFFYRYDCVGKSEREHWPMQPWADLHICCVDAGHGDGTHVVVMLRDGTVFDPTRGTPSRLSDYPSVAYMAAIYSLSILSRVPGDGVAAEREECAKIHDDEIARLQAQIAENDAYLASKGEDTNYSRANKFCRDQIRLHERSATAIRSRAHAK